MLRGARARAAIFSHRHAWRALLGCARLTAHMFLYCLPPFGQHDDPESPSKTSSWMPAFAQRARPAIEHTATSALAFMSRGLESAEAFVGGFGMQKKADVIVRPHRPDR